MTGPIARILLRYGVGLAAGLAVGDQLAADPDLVLVLTGLIAAGTEAAYTLAKRKGWAT
nr:hypothetical protein [uncultured Roseovarius sp.]